MNVAGNARGRSWHRVALIGGLITVLRLRRLRLLLRACIALLGSRVALLRLLVALGNGLLLRVGLDRLLAVLGAILRRHSSLRLTAYRGIGTGANIESTGRVASLLFLSSGAARVRATSLCLLIIVLLV